MTVPVRNNILIMQLQVGLYSCMGYQITAPLSNNVLVMQLQVYIVYFSMREHYHLSQAALNTIMYWTAAICQDSVNLAGQRIQRKLANITPSVNCDIGDCLDLADHNPFKDCHSDWLRNEFINKHFHVVVCQNIYIFFWNTKHLGAV